VTDWGRASERGIAALDAIRYVESLHRRANPSSTATGNLLRLAQWEWPSTEELELLRRLYEQLGVDAAAHEDLCRLAWLQQISAWLDTPLRLDYAFVERNSEPVLRALADA
jgi:hypothetical protein